MKIPGRLVFRAAFFAAALSAVPAIAAAGGANAAPNPKPDTTQIKVWTNEDVEALGPRFTPASEPAPAHAAPAELAVNPSAASANAAAQDPYALQLASLNEELTAVSNEEDQIRSDVASFRAGSTAVQTGLNVVAPCNGIITDNRIAQLEARRLDILASISSLSAARGANAIAPAFVTTEISPKSLVERYQLLTAQLAETQLTIAGMHGEAASMGATLSQPDPRFGGNMTTNLLQNLYSQQGTLESQISATQDELARAGISQ